MTKPDTPSATPSAGSDRNVVAVDEHTIGLTMEDRLRIYWQRNGKSVLALVVLIVIAIVAKGAWDYRAAQREQEIEREYAAASTPEQLKAFAGAHAGHVLTGITRLRLADADYAAGKSTEAVYGYEDAIATIKTGPLVSRARLYLRSGVNHFQQPPGGGSGSAQPHLIHRLDRETSGLVLIAKNANAAGELGKIWETRAVRKEYLAIVHGHVAPDQGTIDAPLGRDDQSPVAIKDCVRPDGHPAQTEFVVENRFSAVLPGADTPGPLPFSWLRLHPLTGRKHQIRIHLAYLGHPIVGDKIYGGDPGIYLALVERRLTEAQRARMILPQHALHASRLQFEWRGQRHEYTAQPEPAFAQLLAAGG